MSYWWHFDSLLP